MLSELCTYESCAVKEVMNVAVVKIIALVAEEKELIPEIARKLGYDFTDEEYKED